MASQGRGARNKGSGFELKTAKELSRWSNENVQRVPQSGAGGFRFGSDMRMSGDITFPVGSKNVFVYECKKHEGWHLGHLFMNQGDIKKWWEQVVTDARRCADIGLVPCLMFSKNRDNTYVLLPFKQEVYDELSGKYPVSRQNVYYLDVADERQEFDTILMTLDGFTSYNKNIIWDHYRGIDWDVLNK
ncbi:RusA-like Holliday junction resolvase [Bacillus phage W.Ph.]|uniref:Gp61 n=1 Tax=Bacillus phage W.Ph. TaxID=764595 RepID=G9B1G2_9CAUD|nr:RusA-like Holliday junction resolvase [Bacillus phage W.Ph.]ADH03207.1 gp61 [Bacillus phage W.Ph.]